MSSYLLSRQERLLTFGQQLRGYEHIKPCTMADSIKINISLTPLAPLALIAFNLLSLSARARLCYRQIDTRYDVDGMVEIQDDGIQIKQIQLLVEVYRRDRRRDEC